MGGNDGPECPFAGVRGPERARSALHPTRWGLWQFGVPTGVVLLITNLVGVVGLAYAVTRAPGITTADWGLFAMLCACALAYTEVTAASEKRRRSMRRQRGTVEFIDQASIWFFSSALLLPPMLAGALVVMVRVRRWRIAMRPLTLWVSNTAAVLLSVAFVSLLRGLMVGSGRPYDGLTEPDAGGLRITALFVLAALVYFLVEGTIVGVYRAVRFRTWRLGETWGSREDNLLLLHTLLVGLGAVGAAAITPVALFGVLAVAVMETRLLGSLAMRTADRDRLEADATTDPLTGLSNRRGFLPLATAAIRLDRLNGRPTGVLMLDLDHFKRWNDRLGHFGGDQVLQAVARALRQNTRAGDLVARWGGEELTAVLPDTHPAETLKIAERIRAGVEALGTTITTPADGPSVHLGREVPRVTISIGVACAPQHATTLADLQELADQALDVAKQNGRNQVAVVGAAGPHVPTQPGPQDREQSHP
ncbi:GGDEF domain-containing protein [Actinokineospora auranticolor]|uniref:Diguanylate cyclase (GGDEF)-like protein n=1 Tax=Actinokineospora auranticolor TaxID=155976 RepID=A0A2S6H1T1_9PSEU|nr:GGDEF domain-containing protein [Actinokineospora auranticolor]PPK71377.1 diguanylate cyclase (GGDEF)-like protein [Actinokineospora auranticolor]